MEGAVSDEADGGRQWAAQPGFWRQVVEQLGASLVVVGPSGRVVAANPAAERLLSRSAEAMAGKDFHDLVHRHADRERPGIRCRLLEALIHAGEAHADSDRYLCGDGKLVEVSWSAAPVTDGASFEGTAMLFARLSDDRSERAEHMQALEDLTGRLTLVAQITAVLGQTLETDEALARLGRMLVPGLADWVAVDLLVGDDETHRVAVTGPDGRDRGQEGWRARLPFAGESRSPLVQAVRGAVPVLDEDAGAPARPDSPLAALHSGFLQSVGAASALTVPLGSGRHSTGALTLVRTDPAAPFGNDDLQVVVDIGRRVGQVLDNTRRFGRQRDVAEAMQRNLLAPLPQPGRLLLAARYQPAPAASQVGGDWYDAFQLKDGVTALVIGDVVGHDLTAAAGMAQLRGILRSLAWDRTEPPGAIVDRLDDAMPAITTVPMATLVLARVEGPRDGPWTLRWTNAGHPPPLLLTPNGHGRYLDDARGPLLGARTGTGTGDRRPDATTPLPSGSTLLLYTDGLIELRGADLDTGLSRLRRNALALAEEPLDDFCDQLLTRMPPGNVDDIALLALRLPPP
ncbi:SpoIIE family protein phosphatase [Actinacidiphila glaucinigra]|uniref:SpoIIE family protein phosphatase n=1 Tax=Actinacidiphila glaucinigra TaxID=235986 RepID=UPI001FEBBF1D|nr:SpoIIE family protein phosphatase [Actinacidiphila glaucinigra]